MTLVSHRLSMWDKYIRFCALLFHRYDDIDGQWKWEFESCVRRTNSLSESWVEAEYTGGVLWLQLFQPPGDVL